ncbi:hypothetical protein ZWY2020_031963 [Hordeum vulgare]|nr:hypothetical protein ZWY2020_031963 [Hordeum vulgare]
MAAPAAPAAATASAPPAPTIKLLIDAKAKRVLYAEAGKDAVDFLFGILATPVGTVAKLLRQRRRDGSRLHAEQRRAERTPQPAPTSTVSSVSYRPQHPAAAAPPLATTISRGCLGCGSVAACGFVQGLVTYTVMDDLTIAPMSNVSAMALLSKLNGEEKGLVLEEKSVKIGQQEGLAILKASLQSSTVLTDVFVSSNRADVNKRARTTSGDKMTVVQEKNDRTLDYYL